MTAPRCKVCGTPVLVSSSYKPRAGAKPDDVCADCRRERARKASALTRRNRAAFEVKRRP